MKALRDILFLSLYTSSKLSSDKNARMRKRLTAVLGSAISKHDTICTLPDSYKSWTFGEFEHDRKKLIVYETKQYKWPEQSGLYNNYKTVPLITAPCSNIQIVLYFFLLSILGHEGVIEVIKHKVTNNNVNVGDRLTFSIADSCLQCERCEDGIEQKCTALFKVYIPSLFFLR